MERSEEKLEEKGKGECDHFALFDMAQLYDSDITVECVKRITSCYLLRFDFDSLQ